MSLDRSPMTSLGVACVVGVPDEKVGERVKAIVVLKEDARGVGGAELIKWCRQTLSAAVRAQGVAVTRP